MRTCLVIIALIFISSLAYGQLMQYRFKEPVKIGSRVNTVAEETYPLIDEHNNKLYFVRALSGQNVGGRKGGQDIWVTKLDTLRPTNKLGPLNNKGNNGVIGINPQGDKLYLLNVYKSGHKMKPGISMSNIILDSITPPEEVPLPYMEISGNFYGFWMNPEGDTLLISMEGEDTKGKEDLYVCLKVEGKWQQPVNLGSQINSFGYEMSPFLGKDGRTLFFASDGKGG